MQGGLARSLGHPWRLSVPVRVKAASIFVDKLDVKIRPVHYHITHTLITEDLFTPLRDLPSPNSSYRSILPNPPPAQGNHNATMLMEMPATGMLREGMAVDETNFRLRTSARLTGT